MDTMRIIVGVDVAPKDDGEYPNENAVVAYMQDILADMTKHDREIPWRVVKVESR